MVDDNSQVALVTAEQCPLSRRGPRQRPRSPASGIAVVCVYGFPFPGEPGPDTSSNALPAKLAIFTAADWPGAHVSDQYGAWYAAREAWFAENWTDEIAAGREQLTAAISEPDAPFPFHRWRDNG